MGNPAARVVSLPDASAHADLLPYHVELWTPSRAAVERILGQSGSMVLAAAIFQAALQEYPGRLVTLSRGGERLRHSEQDLPPDA